MASLNEVVSNFWNNKPYKRMLEDGGFEQITPLAPLAMCDVRYTLVNREGDFVTWQYVALEVLLDPHSGFAKEGWEEL